MVEPVARSRERLRRARRRVRGRVPLIAAGQYETVRGTVSRRHKHDKEDEFFYVVEGKLLLDVEGRGTTELSPRQGMMVPRGVVHRTRAPSRTVVLMIEAATVVPTGD